MLHGIDSLKNYSRKAENKIIKKDRSETTNKNKAGIPAKLHQKRKPNSAEVCNSQWA